MNPGTRKIATAATKDEGLTAQGTPIKQPHEREHDARPCCVIGLDLSDRTAHYAVVGPVGEDWRAEKKIQLNRDSLRRHFAEYAGSLLVMEVGAHSRWVQPVLEELGLEVFVAHAASIPGITGSVNKHDRADARQLARLGRADCGPSTAPDSSSQRHSTIRPAADSSSFPASFRYCRSSTGIPTPPPSTSDTAVSEVVHFESFH